jgi:hypothetical protein
MELAHKTTILFPPALFERLVQLAKQRGASLEELVRLACEAQYGGSPGEERRRALDELRSLSLPVGTPGEMKEESLSDPREPLSVSGRQPCVATIGTSTSLLG